MRRVHYKFFPLVAQLCLPALLASESVFPTLQSSDLNKKILQLPGGLKGDQNLLLIAFERKQQADVDTWLQVLPRLLESHQKVAYYEIPVIDKLNPMMRWFINNGMRGGIPDPAQRERTITLYLDKKPFKNALKISTEKQIYVLMLNRKGEILWRSEGTATTDKQRSLEAYLGTTHP